MTLVPPTAPMPMPPTPTLELLRPVLVDELVRVGCAHDGGYVISARAMHAADVLIGLGVNTDWSFEEDFLRRNSRARLVMVDGSISGGDFFRQGVVHAIDAVRVMTRRHWDRAREEWSRGVFYRKLSRSFRDFVRPESRLFIPRMIEESAFAGGLTVAELADVVAREFPGASDRWFVKMDIEGGEYRVLPQMLRHADRITGIAIEFHDCDLLWPRLVEMLEMLQQHFVLVHVHGNNCAPLIAGSDVPRVLELSFLHRTLSEPERAGTPSPLQYPLPGLDMPNDPARPDYSLTFSS